MDSQEKGNSASAEAAAAAISQQDEESISKIQSLVQAQDDTQRFVGLALLKSVLDNSPELQQNHGVVQRLWDSLPAKFLDRLLRTGSNPSKRDSKEMLDLVVSVLHTFAVLLPEGATSQPKFTDRIPRLVSAVLNGSEETVNMLLQLLYTLVSRQEGAMALVRIDDLSSITEIAPSHAVAMDVLLHAWLNAMVVVDDTSYVANHIDGNVQSLVASFRGTDAVTLLEFLGQLLRQASSEVIPANPKWLGAVVSYIRNLVTSRPNSAARSAYTNAAASLLRAYPIAASKLIFKAEKGDEKPFSYLFVNLLLIDIRSSAPLLLEQLNKPGYSNLSRRLASAFDIICILIGHLVRSLEDESLESLIMSPDNLLKLRKGISETMSVNIEYLRDRWDATYAGAMGLHPDARSGKAETSTGSRLTLTWDSLENLADEDPFVLSAVRALALWLREDENDMLRKEATGLTDMFMDLYRGSLADKLDFRSPTLVALEALVTFEKGRNMLFQHDGWDTLSQDLCEILRQNNGSESETSRGIEIIRVLLPVAEESSGTNEEWMNLITAVAAWDVFLPSQDSPRLVMLELQVAALQLCCALLIKASPGMRRRYAHSVSALAGIATQLEKRIPKEGVLREDIEDVLEVLGNLSQDI
ncbi:Neurochondrin domain-containing protein [Trichoderma austrokoningii]